MSREAIHACGVNLPEIIAPWRAAALPVPHAGKNLLVPSQGAEELRGKLVFRLHKLSESISVADARDLEASLIKLDPSATAFKPLTRFSTSPQAVGIITRVGHCACWNRASTEKPSSVGRFRSSTMRSGRVVERRLQAFGAIVPGADAVAVARQCAGGVAGKLGFVFDDEETPEV